MTTYTMLEDTRHQVPGYVLKEQPYRLFTFDRSLCAEAMASVLATEKRTQATVYGDDGSTSVQQQHRNTHVYSLECVVHGKLLARMMDQLVKNVVEFEFGIEVRAEHGVQVLGYGEGCFFNSHADNANWTAGGWKKTANRDFSAILWLSDCVPNPGPLDHSGGELELTNWLAEGDVLTVVPRCGSLLVMPANPIYRHAVRPVTAGYRVALVNWWAAVSG